MKKVVMILGILMMSTTALAQHNSTPPTPPTRLAPCIQAGESWGCWRSGLSLSAERRSAYEGLFSNLKGRGIGLGSLSAAQSATRHGRQLK